MISDACWAMSYITDGPNDRISAVIQHGVVPKLVEHLSCGQISIQVVICVCICSNCCFSLCTYVNTYVHTRIRTFYVRTYVHTRIRTFYVHTLHNGIMYIREYLHNCSTVLVLLSSFPLFPGVRTFVGFLRHL